jgi:hypothetical protein
VADSYRGQPTKQPTNQEISSDYPTFIIEEL